METQDRVRRRLPIHLTKDLKKLWVLQYSLRPPDHPYQFIDKISKVEKVQYKPKEKFDPDSHHSPHEQVKITYRIPRRDELQHREWHLKSKEVLCQANHAALFVKNGIVYMAPINSVQHVTPDLSELAKQYRKSNLNQDIKIETEPVVQWVELKARKKNDAHFDGKINENFRKRLNVSHRKEFDERLMGSKDPPSKTSNLLSRNKILQLETISARVISLMKQVHIFSFTDIKKFVNCHSSQMNKLILTLKEECHYIHGCWVIRSHQVYRAENKILQYQRNCLLELLFRRDSDQIPRVNQKTYSLLSQADLETTENILNAICRPITEPVSSTQIWGFKCQPDNFDEIYPDVVLECNIQMKELIRAQNEIRESWNQGQYSHDLPNDELQFPEEMEI